MKVDVLIDNNNSFLNFYKKKIKTIISRKYKYRFFNNANKIKKGDILFLLGCQKILKEKKLKYHKLNLVIHPSKLPKGKGHAALFHEILKGNSFFYITMFDANSKIDAGDIVMVKKFYLKGHELHDEIRSIQGNLTMQMISDFIKKYPKVKLIKQKGKSTFCKKRSANDHELDIKKSIKKQFNLLRISDNKNYPAFFFLKKYKYILNIKRIN